MPFAQIDLRVQFSGSAMRSALDGNASVEVWLGTRLLGTLSGETLRALIVEKLAAADIAARLRDELTRVASPPAPPASAAIGLPDYSRKPPRPVRELRRLARRSRRSAFTALLALSVAATVHFCDEAPGRVGAIIQRATCPAPPRYSLPF